MTPLNRMSNALQHMSSEDYRHRVDNQSGLRYFSTTRFFTYCHDFRRRCWPCTSPKGSCTWLHHRCCWVGYEWLPFWNHLDLEAYVAWAKTKVHLGGQPHWSPSGWGSLDGSYSNYFQGPRSLRPLRFHFVFKLRIDLSLLEVDFLSTS